MPESAHGTNPATAAFLGYSVRAVPARDDGTVDVEAVKAALSPEVAAIMLTNPNTCGLFEPEVIEIAAAVHEAGAFFYCDGANCIQAKTAGEACTNDEECGATGWCGADGSCAARLSVDAACTASNQCASDLCYTFSAGDQTCVDRLRLSRSEPVCENLR